MDGILVLVRDTGVVIKNEASSNVVDDNEKVLHNVDP